VHVEPPSARPAYRFGPFRLSPAERALTCGDDAVTLPPKVFDLLQLLVVEEGRLVSRERIVEAIWPDAFVSETNLRQTIWQLRRSLRRLDAQDGACIETVPRHGYRFLTPVCVESPPPPALAAAAAPARRPVARAALLLAGTLLAVLGPGHDAPTGGAPVGASVEPVRARHAVAVLRLRTHSGDARDGWIAEALTEILRAELAGSPSLRLVPAETIEREAADLSPPRVLSLSAESLSRLRDRMGGDTVVAGALVAAGPGPEAWLRVDLLVQCTHSRAVTAALTHSGLRRDLPELAGRAERDLRRLLASRTTPTAG
jgi:DNA-binding winged helix-turn-helix (wHTH) protein